nr:hypothetical protein BaRGS_005537 [Batillaria attramentaria]
MDLRRPLQAQSRMQLWMDVGLQPGRLRAGLQDGWTTQDGREATSEWMLDHCLDHHQTEGWTAGGMGSTKMKKTPDGTWDCSLGDHWTEADQEQEVNRAAGQHPEKDCTAGQRQETGDSVGYDKIGHADGHHLPVII